MAGDSLRPDAELGASGAREGASAPHEPASDAPEAPDAAAGPEPTAALDSASAAERDAPPSAAPEAIGPAHQPTEAALTPTPNEQPLQWIDRVVDDRYRVMRRLGEGGMGAVFVAEHLTLHKAVALKVIRAELAGNGEVAARFAREAMATARFEHPHVASAIDFGTLPEGGAYFVMQLVRGKSLRGLCTRGKRLPWRRAAEICAQVADALSAAKAHGIIHRDLKPDNILVEQREDGSDLVKVLDFGIAHVAPRDAGSTVEGGATSRQLTRVGTVMGTPGYMSPEQAVGDKVDHRTDLYALGVVLWECITGRELWDGPDLTTVVTRQMSEPVPKLRDAALDPLIPSELDELVQRLTSRTVSDRPDAAAEVRDTLRRLSHADVDGFRISTVGLRAVVSTLRPRVETAVTRFRAQTPRNQGIQVAGGLFALVLLFGLLFSGGPEPGAAATAAGTAGAADAAGAPASAPAAGAAARTATEEPQAFARVAATAKEVVEKVKLAVEEMPTARSSNDALPPELGDDGKQLLEGESVRERRAAADAILAYRPKERIPTHLRMIAEFETARSCKARKQLIAKMEQARDPRYLPPLNRMARAPKSGCGFLSLSDCYSCVRRDVNRAVTALEGPK